MANLEAIYYALIMMRGLKRQAVLKDDENDKYHIFNNMYSIMDITVQQKG